VRASNKPIGKGPHFKERDIFIDYPFEEVMFRSDHLTGKIFQKFYGEDTETEIHFSARLFNESLLSGNEITQTEYSHGKLRS
jgi:hypothetical protein